jgi:phage gp36-like protein
MYCTQADLIAEALSEDELIQLTDDEGMQAVNTARVNAAIDAAGQLIDGYLRGRYTLPLDPVPGIIKQLCITISVYNVYRRRRMAAMPESLEKRYAADLKLLGDIQKGNVVIGQVAPGETQPSGQNYKTNKTDADRVFGKDVLDKF